MKTKIIAKKRGIILMVMLGTFAQIFGQMSKIELKDISAQKALVMRTTIPSANVSAKMGELYGKLFAYINANGIQATGAPFAVYYTYDPNGSTEFEVGIPVATDQQGKDEIKFRGYPAMRVISALHTGPYENAGAVYEALKKYATDNKLETLPLSWEIYLTDPSQVKDPAKYRTNIYFVIK